MHASILFPRPRRGLFFFLLLLLLNLPLSLFFLVSLSGVPDHGTALILH